MDKAIDVWHHAKKDPKYYGILPDDLETLLDLLKESYKLDEVITTNITKIKGNNKRIYELNVRPIKIITYIPNPGYVNRNDIYNQHQKKQKEITQTNNHLRKQIIKINALKQQLDMYENENQNQNQNCSDIRTLNALRDTYTKELELCFNIEFALSSLRKHATELQDQYNNSASTNAPIKCDRPNERAGAGAEKVIKNLENHVERLDKEISSFIQQIQKIECEAVSGTEKGMIHHLRSQQNVKLHQREQIFNNLNNRKKQLELMQPEPPVSPEPTEEIIIDTKATDNEIKTLNDEINKFDLELVANVNQLQNIKPLIEETITSLLKSSPKLDQAIETLTPNEIAQSYDKFLEVMGVRNNVTNANAYAIAQSNAVANTNHKPNAIQSLPPRARGRRNNGLSHHRRGISPTDEFMNDRFYGCG